MLRGSWRRPRRWFSGGKGGRDASPGSRAGLHIHSGGRKADGRIGRSNIEAQGSDGGKEKCRERLDRPSAAVNSLLFVELYEAC